MQCPGEQPPTQAVFLIGGRGTRLGALAASVPKPLLPLGDGRPFLDLLIDNAVRQGASDILLLAGHLGDIVRETYGGRHHRGVPIRVVVEPEPLGTGGALVHARAHLAETFLLANGDTFLDANLVALWPHLGDDTDGVIALRAVDDMARYGAVTVRDGRAVNFEEKRGVAVPGLINAGSYLLRRAVLDGAPEGPFSFETDLLPRLAQSGRLAAHVTHGAFIDIGLPETLAEARATLTVARPRPALFLDRDGVINVDDGYVHRPDQVGFIPGAIETIRLANDAGWHVFVVTNQAGVARGFYDEATLHALHGWMQARFREAGAFVDTFYHCPYHPEAVVPQYRSDHPDRKPKPGMLLRAMADWSVDRERSVLIGDRDTDLAAAAAAGVRGVLFEGGNLAELARPLIAPVA